jgi:hypothetical protein
LIESVPVAKYLDVHMGAGHLIFANSHSCSRLKETRNLPDKMPGNMIVMFDKWDQAKGTTEAFA